jgi:hypothetical protein
MLAGHRTRISRLARRANEILNRRKELRLNPHPRFHSSDYAPTEFICQVSFCISTVLTMFCIVLDCAYGEI